MAQSLCIGTSSSVTIKLVRLVSGVILLLLLIFVKSTFAGESPTLLSPTDNSTVTSSKLEWQAPSYQLYSSNPYRIQVDDDSSFSSINKDYYTNNTYYTPSLSLGTWYWKVKAKDSIGSWSNWSSVWSFTLTDSPPTASPTTQPTSNPTPTSVPSSTPSSSSSTPSSSSFTISNTPSQVTSDETFTILVNLSLPNSPNTSFYLKGAFKKADGSNYFGLTKVSGSWVKNGSTYSNQYAITTDSSGNWSGNLEIQPDNEDSGFEGSGDYIFKVGRYTQSGSGPTWSNEVNLKIISTSSKDSVDQGSSQTSNTTSPQTTPIATKSKIQTSSSKSSNSLAYRTASVAGTTTSASPSATPSAEESSQVKEQKFFNLNIWAISGSIFIIAGLGSIGFIYLRSKKIK